VFDDNPNKVGKRTHFGHVIYPTSALGDERYVLIAAWNYEGELRARFPGHRRWLIPHPMRSTLCRPYLSPGPLGSSSATSSAA
jgi:hypothetical protein